MTKQIVCADAGMDCSFVVQSESEDELVEMVTLHGEHQHDVEMEKNDIRDLIKPA
ncbi:DUF1059 domain-containing protein [Halobaculum gomorrense]|uniref:Small metal-binding protein n=1 Tax=Halobaculum gomorrense TaxID=43928 RepID=A0A1M5P595_9EURY|nr:DUF1059 domain-containing protein [Halobaculum gomorrense]SHG96966.1 Protein of unknown function [Halobaculum gomorrense]